VILYAVFILWINVCRIVNNIGKQITVWDVLLQVRMDQINCAVAQVDGMTQKNAQLVSENNNTSQSLKTQSNQLFSLLDRFVLNQSLKT
jgi:methyl-accepting chemotaxis protein